MTREDIIRMAKEAGYGTTYYGANNEPLIEEVWGGPLETRKLERFANLVAAAEREECAKVCDGVAIDDAGYLDCVDTAERCADAIRARSNP